MQITRRENESDKDYMTRAFRWSRICHQALERRNARYGATKVPLKSLDDQSYTLPPQAVSQLTPRRAAWYGALVSVACVAVAVIGLAG
jgi:hypothetical protein